MAVLSCILRWDRCLPRMLCPVWSRNFAAASCLVLCMGVFQGLVACFCFWGHEILFLHFLLYADLRGVVGSFWFEKLGSMAAFFTNVSACSLPKIWQCSGIHSNTTFFALIWVCSGSYSSYGSPVMRQAELQQLILWQIWNHSGNGLQKLFRML